MISLNIIIGSLIIASSIVIAALYIGHEIRDGLKGSAPEVKP